MSMTIMKPSAEKVIIDGREELSGQKVLVDTVAILGARKETAKLRKRQEEMNAREQKLTRSVVDQGVRVRGRHTVSSTLQVQAYCDEPWNLRCLNPYRAYK
ncbi:hypothetical protein AAVH_26312 [Aphelenchoides avenae]|nr:hypothetical protein AAVH_26312 [Aphelenchus avenae]